MKKVVLTIAMICGLGFGAAAQEQYDWEELNLKGNVLTFAEGKYQVQQSFGEWVKYSYADKQSPLIFFNPQGQIWKMEYDEKTADKFDYSDGRLVSIYRVKLWDGNDGWGNKFWNRMDTLMQWEYVYVGDKVSEINIYKYEQNFRWVESEGRYVHQGTAPKKLEGKVKYKYTATGYEKVTYNGKGTFVSSVVVEGKKKTEIGKNNDKSVYQLDAKMRPIKADYYISAKATSPLATLYYKYNAQGDEISVSANANENYNDKSGNAAVYTSKKKSSTTIYEYTYDAQGNWTDKKAYSTGDMDKWIARTITYAQGEADYAKFIAEDKFTLAFVESEIARQKAMKEERDAKRK